MNATATTVEKPVMAHPFVDIRQTRLGKIDAPETLDRLNPSGKSKVAVAAFNASV